jgi:hypothetical protein
MLQNSFLTTITDYQAQNRINYAIIDGGAGINYLTSSLAMDFNSYDYKLKQTKES